MREFLSYISIGACLILTQISLNSDLPGKFIQLACAYFTIVTFLCTK